jgi:hypothetical protein
MRSLPWLATFGDSAEGHKPTERVPFAKARHWWAVPSRLPGVTAGLARQSQPLQDDLGERASGMTSPLASGAGQLGGSRGETETPYPLVVPGARGHPVGGRSAVARLAREDLDLDHAALLELDEPHVHRGGAHRGVIGVDVRAPHRAENPTSRAFVGDHLAEPATVALRVVAPGLTDRDIVPAARSSRARARRCRITALGAPSTITGAGRAFCTHLRASATIAGAGGTGSAVLNAPPSEALTGRPARGAVLDRLRVPRVGRRRVRVRVGRRRAGGEPRVGIVAGGRSKRPGCAKESTCLGLAHHAEVWRRFVMRLAGFLVGRSPGDEWRSLLLDSNGQGIPPRARARD